MPLTRRPPGAHRRGGNHGSRGAAPAAWVGSGVAVADELRRLRPRLVSGLLHDRRHLRIRDEALPALLVPVEDDPHPILLGGIAEDRRAFRSVLLALLGPLRREDVHEPVEILDLRRCEEHLVLLSWCVVWGGLVGQPARAGVPTRRSCGSI